MSVSLNELLETGCHFGHQTKFWNPKMRPFIYGSRGKIHIIDLSKTITLINEALSFVKALAKNKGTILFLGTKAQASDLVLEHAVGCGMPYINYRWLGGMLTNFDTVIKSIKRLQEKDGLLNTTDNNLSKKDHLNLEREVLKMKRAIGGIADMKKLPDALLVLDTGMHNIAVKEANKLGIPIIGIVDTNNSPDGIDYVIPGNDDSSKALNLYLSLFANMIVQNKPEIIEQSEKAALNTNVVRINKKDSKK